MRRHRNKLTFVFRSRFRNASSLNLYRVTPELGETYCTRQYITREPNLYNIYIYGLTAAACFFSAFFSFFFFFFFFAFCVLKLFIGILNVVVVVVSRRRILRVYIFVSWHCCISSQNENKFCSSIFHSAYHTFSGRNTGPKVSNFRSESVWARWICTYLSTLELGETYIVHVDISRESLYNKYGLTAFFLFRYFSFFVLLECLTSPAAVYCEGIFCRAGVLYLANTRTISVFLFFIPCTRFRVQTLDRKFLFLDQKSYS